MVARVLCVAERVRSLDGPDRTVVHAVADGETGDDGDFVAIRCGGGIVLSSGTIAGPPDCPDCRAGTTTLRFGPADAASALRGTARA